MRGLLAMILGLGTASAGAAEYFVSPDGRDDAAGTSAASALRTVQAGIDRLRPGDTLTLAPGEYAERIALRKRGTRDRPVTIRAAVPGFAVLRGDRRIRGFTRVPGTRFIWSAPVDRPVYCVFELDTRLALLKAPALADMDQFRRSYLQDEQAGALYVHTSDGRPPDDHSLTATVLPGLGVDVAGEHIILDGLVIRGFFAERVRDAERGFGLGIKGRDITVANCTLLFNGGGIILDAVDAVVRDNTLVGNFSPGYTELAQIYCTGKSERVRIENNIVRDAQNHGIRNYATPRDGSVTGNIVLNQLIGIDFKASRGRRVARNNVAVGCSQFNWFYGGNAVDLTEDANTFELPGLWDGDASRRAGRNTLVFGPDRPDPRFADPYALDFRLQADSPCRARGPGGSDLGARPYEPTVLYVRPDGDDTADGFSMARALRTLDRATAVARPGFTIYVADGRYGGILRPASSGTPDKPIVIRGRGRPLAARVAGLDVTQRAYLRIENLVIAGDAIIRRAEAVRIEQCWFVGPAAVRVEDARDVGLRRITVSDSPGPAVLITGRSTGIRITSSILRSRAGPAIRSEIGPEAPLFCEYNAYSVPPSQPVAVVAGRNATELAALRSLTGADRYSLTADPQFHSPDGAGIRPGSPCTGAGEAGHNIGAGDVVPADLPPVITDIRLRDLTPTSASFTWWTPNTSSAAMRPPLDWYTPHPVHAELHYGTTPSLDHRIASLGDLYHRVTIRDLQPGTVYHFKIVIPDRPGADSLYGPRPPGPAPPGWRGAASDLTAFTTPTANEWKPTRRRFFVSPGGSEANAGLDPTAPTTLTAVSDRARAGDIITLLDGIYREMFAPAGDGLPDAPITLRAQTPGRACLDGSGFVRPTAVALFGRSHIIIDGVVIRRFADRAYGCRAGLFGSQVFLARCGHITLRNCVLAGWGVGYGAGLVARGGESITIENCVITGFAETVVGRQVRQTSLLNNTWYVPQITNFDLDGRVIVRNNLFFGQERQKVFQYVPMVTARRPADSDYNAFYFGPGNTARYIGYGIQRRDETDMGGLQRVQRELGLDQHSIEPQPADVRLSGPAPVDYLDSAALYQFTRRIGDADLIPTLDMFDVPPRSRLNTAGEGGRPIGARPVPPHSP